MLLSAPTSLLMGRLGYEKTFRLLKDAGFDAYDFSMFAMHDNPENALNKVDYAEYAQKIRVIADKVGIPCNQAHAPFPSSCGNPEKDEQFFEEIVRSIEIASILGAKIIVVHPKHHIKHFFKTEKLKRINLEFYRKLIPYAEKFNIRIATENMWNCRKFPKYRIFDSVCSSPEEFCEYIDLLDSPWICACLDMGHIPLVRREIGDFIEKLGAERLAAVHVHDNDLRYDLHTLPYQRNIDFEPMLKALHDIGYRGDFTFEANAFFQRIPDELLLPAATFMAQVGRYMMAQINRPE